MKKVFYILIVSVLTFFSCSNSSDDVFESVQLGDSLFVTSEYLNIYKKGRIKYIYHGTQDKFAPKDTIDFYSVNSFFIPEDGHYFIQKRNSFLGIAKGIDSTISNSASINNSKWIIVEVDPKIIEWFDSFNDRKKWNNGEVDEYGKNSIGDTFLYVRAQDVQLKNNNEAMRPPSK